MSVGSYSGGGCTQTIMNARSGVRMSQWVTSGY